jgi:hypothetical protein
MNSTMLMAKAPSNKAAACSQAMVTSALLTMLFVILPKASDAYCVSSSVSKPLAISPIEINTYPGSSVSLGCLDGTEPILPEYAKDWCTTGTLSNISDPICGQTGPMTTCSNPEYDSIIDIFCSQGLFLLSANNGTTFVIPDEVWCVSSPKSLWVRIPGDDGKMILECPFEMTCDMTCGHDDDWCTSNEYAYGCITDSPYFFNPGSNSSEYTIADCLMEPPEYLKDVCSGIVTPEGGFVSVYSDTEAEGSTMQMDSPETSNQGVDSISEAETPEDSLAADPSSASIHACVPTFVMMSAAAYCIFYV